jgi:hypothetical protein
MTELRATRREFIGHAAAAAGAALLPRTTGATAPARPAFSFALLGDVHYDQFEHHDMAWMRKEMPGVVSSIPGFVRATNDLLPTLFRTVRETIAELNRTPETRVPFVLQVGDLVEGACGNAELFQRHTNAGLDFVRKAELGAPMVLTKGNHDIWGPGGRETFAQVMHPFLTEQRRAVVPQAPPITSGRYTIEYANSQFVFFDAYDPTQSLEWFEAVAARRTAEHFFLIVHPPVVPYGARSTWTIFSGDKDRPKREKLMEILGAQHGLVLSGHLHRYCALARKTPRGRFAQFALSTVLQNADPQPHFERSGLSAYNGDLVNVEPRFSPETVELRRARFEAERPAITSFDFADMPGWAIVTVDGPRVHIDAFSGVGRKPWRRVDLTGLLSLAPP